LGQREVAESINPAWFYVLSDTYRQAHGNCTLPTSATQNQSSEKCWGRKTFLNVRSREVAATGDEFLCRSPRVLLQSGESCSLTKIFFAEISLV
jgi:hypothetical protein